MEGTKFAGCCHCMQHRSIGINAFTCFLTSVVEEITLINVVGFAYAVFSHQLEDLVNHILSSDLSKGRPLKMSRASGPMQVIRVAILYSLLLVFKLDIIS